MSVLKVVEILASSDKSWDEAGNNAVMEASKTIKNIKSVNIQNMSATVADGKIDRYRVNVKISFEVKS